VKTPTIYFDMDGVLANFDKRVEEILGTDNIYKFEFVYGSKVFWDAIHSGDPFFFQNLEMMPGAYRLLEATDKYPRGIITALPKSKPEQCDFQKRHWVSRNVYTPIPVITCRTNEKPYYCQPGDIMIDDRALNKAAWEARGGKFIVHVDVQSTLEQLKTMGVE
jgi:5'(3')-deoxyribonucleotidase